MWDSLAFVIAEISHASNEQATYFYSALPFYSIVPYLYFATKGDVKLHFKGVLCDTQEDACLIAPL